MILRLLFLLFFLINANALACGTYAVNARVTQIQGYPQLLINPGTQSEIRLSLNFTDTPKLSAYIGNTISAEIEISEMTSTIGKIEKISKITRYFTSELSQTGGTALKQLKATICRN